MNAKRTECSEVVKNVFRAARDQLTAPEVNIDSPGSFASIGTSSLADIVSRWSRT